VCKRCLPLALSVRAGWAVGCRIYKRELSMGLFNLLAGLYGIFVVDNMEYSLCIIFQGERIVRRERDFPITLAQGGRQGRASAAPYGIVCIQRLQHARRDI
jgi:hypothetical protein